MRTKAAVLRDLHSEQNRLTSLERTAHNTPNAKTASINDAIIPSVKRKIAELEAELETAPMDQPRTHGVSNKIVWGVTPNSVPDDYPEMPRALRRNPGGNDAP